MMVVASSTVLCSCFVILLLATATATATATASPGSSDTITTTQSIRDGDGKTLISSGGGFELGFFSPGHGTTSRRYLGIWYKKIPTRTVVWVANRATPLPTSSGVLKLTQPGVLTLLNGTQGNTVWSSNSSISIPFPAAGTGSSRPGAQGGIILASPTAQLLESGNLVVRARARAEPAPEKSNDNNTNKDDHIIWQSFDYPGDTFLAGMKIGKNMVTGMEWHLTSWKSYDDPSPGDYTYGLDARGYPQRVTWKRGSIKLYRNGPWNGLQFSGMPRLSGTSMYRPGFECDTHEVSYDYHVLDPSAISRGVLNPSGVLQGFRWNRRTLAWINDLTFPTDTCDTYATCGAYGGCRAADAVQCECLGGFVPKNPEDWGRWDWSEGCVRRAELSCPHDGFLTYSLFKLPDATDSWFDRDMNLEECKATCLTNCSCTAYSSLDISSGSATGCLLWFGDLLDMRIDTDSGQEIYVRMASSEIGQPGSPGIKRAGIAIGCILGMFLLGFVVSVYLWRKKSLYRQGKLRDALKNTEEDIEVPLFNFLDMSNATNQFSIHNKIGEGGFGPVYKGRLGGEQDIAVKILSEGSNQGVNEFKNEVLFIAKLQHRNLVKLIGCCIQKRKMLIYEYMPNKSLDDFIFDKERSKLLDWPKRLHIIDGISRGLLYLHQDSRLRIIHRDLKASNILLDSEMNPKISDFGLARSFQENQTKIKTKLVVGTHGYMSPEYAVDGLFSIKSDVFSFGVLILEIVSGKRNWRFIHPDHHFNLLGHAWKLYTEDKPLKLVDSSLANSYNPLEASLLIHLGLLCVQRHPEDRPNMAQVLQMIGKECPLFPAKQPGFFNERNPCGSYSSSSKYKPCSNEGSITTLEPR